MKKAFIFDMDGVIINSEPLHFEVESKLAARHGIKLKEGELESYVGVRAKDMWVSLKQKHGVTIDIDEILAESDREKMACLKQGDYEPIAGIGPLLRSLKEKGYHIGLGSSSPPAFIDAVLSAFQISDYFNVVLSGEEVRNGKPSPDIYLAVAEKLGVSPEACTVLEDAAHGVEAGKAAGMGVIGYKNTHSGDQDLSKADHQVDAIEDIHVNEQTITFS